MPRADARFCLHLCPPPHPGFVSLLPPPLFIPQGPVGRVVRCKYPGSYVSPSHTAHQRSACVCARRLLEKLQILLAGSIGSFSDCTLKVLIWMWL